MGQRLVIGLGVQQFMTHGSILGSKFRFSGLYSLLVVMRRECSCLGGKELCVSCDYGIVFFGMSLRVQ